MTEAVGGTELDCNPGKGKPTAAIFLNKALCCSSVNALKLAPRPRAAKADN